MNTIAEFLSKALGGLTGAGQKIAESILGTFSDDGALSMDNIGQLMLVFGLGEILGKDEPSKEAAKKLQKQFMDFLPKYVEQKVAAGKMEQTALSDLNDLLNYGVVTKRNDQGQVISRKQEALGGKVDLEYEQLYGVKPQYEVDASGNVVIDQQTGNPKTVSTGRPGLVQRAGEAQREQQRLGDLARTATRVDQLAQSGQPLAQGLRRMEQTLSPEVQQTQRQVGQSFRGLLAAQDPSRLSGAEEAQVARGLGRMGIGLGRTSEMDKYRAAMTFGDALAAKQQRLGQALGQTGSVVPSLKSNINPGVVFGEGTTTMPTMPGQVTSFGNTAAQALAPISTTATMQGQGTKGKDLLSNVILGGITGG